MKEKMLSPSVDATWHPLFLRNVVNWPRSTGNKCVCLKPGRDTSQAWKPDMFIWVLLLNFVSHETCLWNSTIFQSCFLEHIPGLWRSFWDYYLMRLVFIFSCENLELLYLQLPSSWSDQRITVHIKHFLCCEGNLKSASCVTGKQLLVFRELNRKIDFPWGTE